MEFLQKELFSGENDQIILDEIFLAIEMKIINKDDLISTLENRFISGDNPYWYRYSERFIINGQPITELLLIKMLKNDL